MDFVIGTEGTTKQVRYEQSLGLHDLVDLHMMSKS